MVNRARRRSKTQVHTQRDRSRDCDCRSSGRSTQVDHRKMLPPGDVAHVERDCLARGPASRLVRPACPGFDTTPPSSSSREDFARRPAVQCRVRPMLVVPAGVEAQLAPDRGKRHRSEQQPSEALLLHRSDEPLDNGDAVRLAKEAEAATDSASLTPAFVPSVYSSTELSDKYSKDFERVNENGSEVRMSSGALQGRRRISSRDSGRRCPLNASKRCWEKTAQAARCSSITGRCLRPSAYSADRDRLFRGL